MSYARGTKVTTDRSKNEIERTLARYGASQFFYGWDALGIVVGFRLDRWNIKLTLPTPNRNDYLVTPTGKVRADSAIEQLVEQETRRRWRSLLLVVKAKLEAVESGIATFENEFLSYIVAPDGTTVGDLVLPKLEQAIESGEMPRSLMPG